MIENYSNLVLIQYFLSSVFRLVNATASYSLLHVYFLSVLLFLFVLITSVGIRAVSTGSSCCRNSSGDGNSICHSDLIIDMCYLPMCG